MTARSSYRITPSDSYNASLYVSPKRFHCLILGTVSRETFVDVLQESSHVNVELCV